MLREGRCQAYRFCPNPWTSSTSALVPPPFRARRFRTIASGTTPRVTTTSFTNVSRSWRSMLWPTCLAKRIKTKLRAELHVSVALQEAWHELAREAMAHEPCCFDLLG